MLARFLQGAAKRGQLQFVGAIKNGWGGATSGNNTLSLTALTGGIASSAQAGDFVIAVYATGSTGDRTLTITDGTTNYTLIGSELYSNAAFFDTNLRVAYKRLTGADASVTFGPTTNALDGGAAIVYVWRGVSSTTPLDVAATTSTGINTGRPDPPAITPVSAGSKIIVIGAAASGTGVAFTASYLSSFQRQGGIDSNDIEVGIGYVDWTSGAYNPAQFTGGTTEAGHSWAALTLALRPA